VEASETQQDDDQTDALLDWPENKAAGKQETP
jgi:hypothetical protein